MKRFMKVLFATVFAAVTAFSFAACGGGNKADELRVGMECGYQPFNYTQIDDANGAVKISNAPGYANGYDVMIAKKIAEELGKKLVIVKYEFKALVPAVDAGTLDFIIAGMSPTAERREVVDFSDAYYESNLVIVVRKDGAYKDAKNLDDFSGANIVAQIGTFHDAALEAQGAAHGIVRGTPVATFPLMINALNNKAIDGYVAEEPGAIADCTANPDLTYVKLINNATGFTATAEDVQIAVGFKKNSDIKTQVNAALAKIDQSARDQMMRNAIAYATGGNVESEE